MRDERKFIKSFQGIRGYAIFLIFLSHCNFGVNRYGVNRTGHLGGLGVELFILLSGYLLMQNHSSGEIDLLRYMKQKLIKFYPLHLLTLFLALPFSIRALWVFSTKAWMALLLNIFLLQAWIPDSEVYFSYNAVSWYLSVTMFFVCISPLVVKFWNTIKIQYVLFVIAGLFMSEILLCAICRDIDCAHWLIYVFPFVRSIDYILGGGIWKLNESKTVGRLLDIIFWFGIVVVFLNAVVSLNTNSEWFSVCLWTIPCAAIIYSAAGEVRKKRIIYIFKPIGFLGEISFELFLFHQLCIRYLEKIALHMGLMISRVGIMVISFSISVLVAIICRHLWMSIRFCMYKRGFSKKHGDGK